MNRSMNNGWVCGISGVWLAAMVMAYAGCSRPDSPTTGPKQERPSAVNSTLGTEQVDGSAEPLVSTQEQAEEASRSAAPPLAAAPFDAAAAKRHQAAWSRYLAQQVEVTNSIGMKLTLIPPGEFMMGSTREEIEELSRGYSHVKDALEAEKPQHRVRITMPYYLGTYEVTQAEYLRVMGTNPSAFSPSGPNSAWLTGLDTRRFPVEQVSWEDAMEFCRKLSALSAEQSAGRVYRLPTEAEWEFACRAGTTTPFHFGAQLNGREANCDGGYPYGTTTKGTYLKRPTTVGSYEANGFGLYDMHGNVWEWCSDWYDTGYYANSPTDDPTGPASGLSRVIRGGSWVNSSMLCRAGYRRWEHPSIRDEILGFRLAFTSVDQSDQ